MMRRRDFLRTVGAAGAAGALGGVAAACSQSDDGSRRRDEDVEQASGPLERPDGDGPWVLVIGGGVAGMSAAHELRERGLPVTVLEKRDIPGGKARSLLVPDSGTGGRQDLPGEHGFRFFPGFYLHLPDTMKRIPFPANPSGVFGNLVSAPVTSLSRAGQPDITLPLVDMDLTLESAQNVFHQLFTGVMGLSDEEADFFTLRMAGFLASCDERRLAEYEQQDWWDFIGADRFSDDYRQLLAIGVTRNTVAARAEDASARTMGLVLTRFLNQLSAGGDQTDRLLNGPTNDVWIQPWLDHLRAQGVAYHLGATVTSLRFADGRIAGVEVDRGQGPELVEADEYVLALPIEVANRLMTRDITRAAPELAAMANLRTSWMNGIQYFLNEPAPIIEGHLNYLDSPWALTSVSQQQFWPDFALASDYGDGRVQDILSVDISNWDRPGILYGKPATACTEEEIAQEVWEQIKAHLNDAGQTVLPDRIRHRWFLDPAITFPAPGQAENDEPLLINTAGSWSNRPTAETSIANLYLASDYVQTDMDLATMEAANEAARRTVNAILAKHSIGEPPCEIFAYQEPAYMAELRQQDCDRFASGELNILDQPAPA